MGSLLYLVVDIFVNGVLDTRYSNVTEVSCDMNYNVAKHFGFRDADYLIFVHV